MTKTDILSTSLTDKQTALYYIGQEGFIIKSKGKHIAVDPYLSYYVDKNCCQFVKWERLYAPPIEADELDFLDAVLCTHSHYDHADPETLSKIAACSTAKFIAPAPICEILKSYGIPTERIIPAYADKKTELDGFGITPVPSAHEELHTDKNGDYCELGYIIDDGENRIFHAGDMCMYEGLIERLENIDVAILPINGRDFFRNANDIIGNFNTVEAITLSKIIGADLLIPVHHDLYEVNKVNPAVFVDDLMNINRNQKYHIFVPGEKYIYEK